MTILVCNVMGKMHSGGKKSLVMEYYRNLDHNKVQCDFLCDEDSNAIPQDEIEALGGRIYVIPPYQHLIANLREIERICRQNHYQIMHGYNNTLNVFAMYAGKRSGVPIRINEAISMAAQHGDWKTPFKKALKPFSRSYATDYAANGEACGRWQFGDRLFEEGKVKIFKTVINTQKNDFNPEMRKHAREKYGLSDSFVVGHIGRLTEQKNPLFLLDVFFEILKIKPSAKLLLVGDGNLREEVMKKIKYLHLEDNVIYLGRTEEIRPLYNAMDVFLLPSLYEGLPVVGVEAECSGLPVVFSSMVPRE
jgi:glycosyltransferase involved in cell wall biosynthesis